MRIQKLTIRNFRNFKNLVVELGEHAVIVGPNGSGKTNLLHALRLVLDPSLPDSMRQLRSEDFWDGLPRPLPADTSIRVEVELTDFEDDDNLVASLATCLVAPKPMVARLTYLFRPKAGATEEEGLNAFEFVVFGGDDETNRVGYDIRRRMPFEMFHALRDAESDLLTWRKSPLRPLLERAWATVDPKKRQAIAQEIANASKSLVELESIKELGDTIGESLAERLDGGEAADVSVGITSSDPDTLVRMVRLMIDGGRRSVGESSLGLANVLFFTLKLLELRQSEKQEQRDHSFVAIEEPEAHLHPHLQRQMFRGILRPKKHLVAATEPLERLPTTILVSTHSPHIASVAPLDSLVVLRRTRTDGCWETQGSSARAAITDPKVVADMERFLEATRAEMLFARGVILVEGDAEVFLVPKIATLHNKPLDAHGVTVCSIGGVHFSSYVMLLKHLGIPYAVITDGDPDVKPTGSIRMTRLLREIDPNALPSEFKKFGLFVGTDTLEWDLLGTRGWWGPMVNAVEALAATKTDREATRRWVAAKSVPQDGFFKALDTIGKGRFAQRLASDLPDKSSRGHTGPKYILEAIDHVIDAVKESA